MRQLTGVDASFLFMENERTLGHVASLIVVDPSTAPKPITAETLREYIGKRIHMVEPLRWRLVDVPFGIDLPYWITDPNPDLHYHIHGFALEPPGTDRQLADAVAYLATRRLDRSHPLWEIYVINGLQDGTVAIMTKVHHAAVDGKAGVQLTMAMLDPDPDPNVREIPPRPDTTESERVPSEVEMLARGWVGLLTRPEVMMRVAADVAKLGRGLGRLWTAGGEQRGRLPKLPATSAPKLSFNRTLSARRNWAFRTLSLATVKQIKSELGCTVNDVVMAICAGALRRWLIDHDELPDVPLLAFVPVSIRAAEQTADAGNQVSAMISELPTHLADPLERLQAAHQAMSAAKDIHHAVPARLLQDMSRFAAPAAAELITRTVANLKVADRVPMPFNVCISNVPGPRIPLYYAGARMTSFYPVSMVADGMGLNITVQSYLDSLDFGLISTPELVPDIWQLIDYFDEALAELAAAAAGVAAPESRTTERAAAAANASPRKTSARKAAPAKAAKAAKAKAAPAKAAKAAKAARASQTKATPAKAATARKATARKTTPRKTTPRKATPG